MIKFIRGLIAVYNAIKQSGGNPQSPQYWVRKLFGGGSTISGIDINEDTALKFSPVWAAVNIISGAVGYLPMIAYRRSDRNRQSITDHNAARLLHYRPNPFMNALTFKEVLQGHVLTWGNGYAEIERNNAGKPLNLWPLLPDRIEPKIIDKYLYYEVNQPDKVTLLPFDNVLHIHGLGFDGLKGYSPIHYGAENMALGLASEKNAATFFGNDSTPTGVLETETALKKETKEEIEKGWERKHKGLDNKYRIAILHSGLKYHQTGIPAKDAQLIESRKFSVTDVARWFTIPPHMLGDLEKATFSNIEHQGIDFVVFTLAKWLRRWELECSYKLFTTAEQEDLYFEFLVDALLRGDSINRAQVYQIALGGNNNPAYMTVNEVRQRENLPLTDNGDELFRPNYGNTNNANALALYDNAWRRINRAEINAARKAIKKPESFLQWIEEFYAKHKNFIIAIIKPIANAMQDNSNIDTLAALHIDGHKSELKEAYAIGTVEPLLKEWETLKTGVNR